MANVQSVEPNIADLANGWLRLYKLDYKLEQESLNAEIDQALNDYFSKNGGAGGNRPDAKLLLQDKNLVKYPILIEYKGYKDRLVLLDADGKVANKTAKNLPDFKAINSYAVNGAVHYANALLHYTSYTDIIAIGMTIPVTFNMRLAFTMCPKAILASAKRLMTIRISLFSEKATLISSLRKSSNCN